MQKGILTIATGKKRYIDMAKTLAVSLKVNYPHVQRAIVTDSADPELKELFHHIIEPDFSIGKGIIQKTLMHRYSPFDETLFVDADCMVVRSLDFLFEAFAGKDVSALGKKVYDGVLFGVELKKLKTDFNVPHLLSFNGGVYYFSKTKAAAEVFETVSRVRNDYTKYGLNLHRGEQNEEGVMSISMGIHGMEPVDDTIMGMYTPVGQSGQFKMDVLKGYCEFVKNGKKVTPAIMHFGGGYPNAFHYKREKRKLNLVYYYKFPRGLASFLVNVSHNPVYTVHVFFYRIIKKIVKGGKLKFSPVMPMFRFE